MKIYTKTGDKGITSLYTGERKSKGEPIFEILGGLDEINSSIGLAVNSCNPYRCERVIIFLTTLQNILLDIGAYVGSNFERVDKFNFNIVEELEKEIDDMEKSLEPLRTFILPGGSASACFLHQCRVITRRCERVLVSSLPEEKVIKFVNRLSDYFFVAARYVNHREYVEDIKWNQPVNLKKSKTLMIFENIYILFNFIFIALIFYLY